MLATLRAEVIGSLLRPEYLLEARNGLESGELDHHEFKRLEDRAVDETIALQEEIGLDVVTDGEMRRFLFMGPLTEAIEGIEPVSGHTVPWHDLDGRTFQWQVPIAVTGKLRRRRSLVTEEFSYARARARCPLKVTIPSPLVLAELWSPKHTRGAYSSAFEMFEDALAIIREDVRELAMLGCQYIQVDAAEIATFVDPNMCSWWQSVGIPPERVLTEGMDMINSVPDVPGAESVRFAMHLCRGNNQGMWMSEGGYDAIAGAVFGRATRFHAFMLEYDDHRSGSFEPLTQVPDDKTVGLGLISTKSNEVESADEIMARIDDASRYFPREQLALCPQCGFASIALGNPITRSAQNAKLSLIVDVARRVWG